MAVALKTAEILLLLGALGLPVNGLLLAQVDRAHARRTLSGRLLLAPATGLAVFALYTVFFFAAGTPVAAAATAFPLLLAAAWLAWWLHRRLRPARQLPLVRGTRGRDWLLVAAGLAVVALAHLWPFVQNPSLVFWHHAGTDGYMYIRTAEHALSPGTAVIPSVGPYDAASGYLAKSLGEFHRGLLADKPGTMSALAGIAGLLGITPHAAFSPLVIAAVASLFLVLVAFAHLRLRLPAWAACLFAVLGALCPAVWMLSTHTFFGNTLALPLFVLLLLLPGAFPRWGTAAAFGLCLVAQFVIFPDGTPAIVGMLAVATPYLLWCAYRRHRLRRFVLASALAIGIAVALGLPFARPLLGTMHDRLMGVATGLAAPAAASAAAPAPERLKPLAQPDWIWGALNVNTIPPQPLQPAERPYLLYLGILFVLLQLLAGRRRSVAILGWYLVGFQLLLLLGFAGLFRSDYELFRALAIFAFLPLAAVCLLPWVVVPAAGTSRQLAARLAVGAAVAPLLVHFLQVDRHHFAYAYREHASDAQYTVRDLQDRTNLGRAAGQLPLVLGTETPGHFGVFNSLMLFSNLRLGLAPSYHRFAFFGAQPGEAAFGAAGVLRNLHYADISEPPADENVMYRGEHFEVVANDLVPFYDHDTLPPANAYPVDYLRRHNLPVARLYAAATVIAFHNARARPVAVVLQVAGPAATVDFAFDDAPLQAAPVNPGDGTVTLPSPVLPAGVHHLRLGAPARALQLTALWLREADAGGRPLDYDGVRRVRPAEAGHFQFMSPPPVRFFSQYGTNLWGEFLTTHATTRLYFQPAPGAHRLRTSLRLDPGAYENLPPGRASDGVTFEVALVGPDGARTVIHTRRVDPARVPADRGVLPVDLPFTLPPQAQLELSVGPGPDGNGARDWAALGPLTID